VLQYGIGTTTGLLVIELAVAWSALFFYAPTFLKAPEPSIRYRIIGRTRTLVVVAMALAGVAAENTGTPGLNNLLIEAQQTLDVQQMFRVVLTLVGLTAIPDLMLGLVQVLARQKG
jgi:hypothetical protein